VRAALADGPVVCDRYLASVLAVVEVDRSLDAPVLRRLRRAAEDAVLRPDLTVFLVADHGTSVSRSAARGRSSRSMTAVHRRAMESEAYFRAWEGATRRHARRL